MRFFWDCVETRDRSEFLPIDWRVSAGVKEKATHPPFVPPIKGGIIFVKEIQAHYCPDEADIRVNTPESPRKLGG